MHDRKKHDVGGDIKQRGDEMRQTRGVEEQGNRQKAVHGRDIFR